MGLGKTWTIAWDIQPHLTHEISCEYVICLNCCRSFLIYHLFIYCHAMLNTLYVYLAHARARNIVMVDQTTPCLLSIALIIICYDALHATYMRIDHQKTATMFSISTIIWQYSTHLPTLPREVARHSTNRYILQQRLSSISRQVKSLGQLFHVVNGYKSKVFVYEDVTKSLPFIKAVEIARLHDSLYCCHLIGFSRRTSTVITKPRHELESGLMPCIIELNLTAYNVKVPIVIRYRGQIYWFSTTWFRMLGSSQFLSV